MPPEITATRVSRQARIHTCRTCAAPVLTGLDADRCALTTTVDAYALTPAGEVWALRDGRRTYTLHRGQLDRRDRWNIPGHPPSPQRTVLATHTCHQPIPLEHHRPPTPRPFQPTSTEEPPF